MAIWPGKSKNSTKKYQVKLQKLKLERLLLLLPIEVKKRAKIGIETKFLGPKKFGFSSFYKKSHQVQSFFSKEIEVLELGGEFFELNNIEFDNICSFSISSKDHTSFAPWIVSFHILYGECEELSSSSKSLESGKMQVIGKARLDLGELATKMEAQIEQRIPISLELDGFHMEQEQSSLQVTVSFNEMKNTSHSRTLSQDSYGILPNSSESPSLLRRANSQGVSLAKENKAKKNKIRLFGKQLSLKHSVVESSTTFSSEKTDESSMDPENSGANSWEERELISRDSKTKLNASLFFASFDQCSEQAAGESACAAIVAVIAHWLQLYPDLIFTAREFDRLITEGSSEWRKLCNHESNQNNSYLDQYFDLETILGAQLRPLSILPNNSRFGFFHPEEFDHLKDAASFDEIWNEINTNVNEFDPKVYIVRWNEHFFVLKVESDANYIIDSLGERLYEGCKQAYVLKFDDSSVMYEKEEDEKGDYKVIFRGKECCREYMKRFLAAISVRELKEDEAKGKIVDVFVLYKRLQIDFHLSSNSSTANSSVTGSPDTEAHSLGD